MRARARGRALIRDESGLTLIEMLVAALMSVIIVGASCAMLISAVRDQPALSKKAQNVTTARYQLERIVRELRNGVQLETTTPAQVTLVARVRRVACGGAVQTSPSADPVQCRITYSCSGGDGGAAEPAELLLAQGGGTCTRSEASLDGTPVGTSTVAISGLGDTDVFCFVPSAEADPSECGAAQEGEEAVPPTYVGVNLDVPNPEGPGLLTVSDGATLRTAAFRS
jgi:type II secretory pathway pseudopilin PulG